MMLSLPAGLSGLLADVREFILAIRLARPDLLWLLLLLPFFGIVNRYSRTRTLANLERMGHFAAVEGLRTQPVPRRRRLGLGIAYPLAWLALILALAGPRWGKGGEKGVAVGRDIVLVVDLSQSMKADDMASAESRQRWQAARAGCLDLMDSIVRHGGHRIAVIAFAARPKLLAPLTTDYDHVRAIIEGMDGNFPPPEVRPGAAGNIPSGTRIGAALLAAVEAHDPRFPGSQDIILISDGDDPGDDREWALGTNAARKAAIPVHVVGVGNPDVPAIITVGDPMNPELIQTKLDAGLLKQIASETRGEYLAANRDVPRLGEFFQASVEPNRSREVSDDAIAQLKDRYLWLLVPALVLFAIGWLRGR